MEHQATNVSKEEATLPPSIQIWTWRQDRHRSDQTHAEETVVKLKNEEEISIKAHNTLTGHSKTVYALTVIESKNLLISGSHDQTIRVDSLLNFSFNRDSGHTWGIFSLVSWSSLQEAKCLLFSGSGDHSIKVWDVDNNFECLKTIKEHKYEVRALAVSGNKLFSGSYDMSIKVWDILKLELLHSMSITGPPFALTVDSKRLYCAEWNRVIHVFSLDNYNEETTLRGLDGHKSVVYCLKILDKTLYSGSMDKTVKAWNLDTMEHIRTLEGHKDGVQCLGSVGNQLLLSGSEDKTVRLWTSDGTSAGCLNAINCVRAMVVVGDRIIVGIEI